MHPSKEQLGALRADPLLWAAVEAVPRAVAAFSDGGLLLIANSRFVRAVRLEPAPRPGEHRDSLLGRAFDSVPDHPGVFRTQSGTFKATWQQLDSGQLLLWLDEAPQGESERGRRCEFLSIASHDLRGPMANARSYASLLLSPRMELNERARHCAEVIQRNADRALSLLQQCCDLFLYELGALDLDCAEQDLLTVFRASLESVKPSADAKRVKLAIQLPTTLPAASVDRERLTLAVSAFPAYAIQRSDEGQLVKFEVREQPGEVLVETSDEASADGGSATIGIYEAEERAVLEGKLAEGFRLGLARAAIEAHGGHVGVRANSAGGITLFFTLPIT